MALIDISGTVTGHATQTGLLLWRRSLAGITVGHASGSGTLLRVLLTSGFAYGHGLLYLWHEDSAGHAYGHGVLSGAMVRPVVLHGAAWGQGKVFLSSPMPMQGHVVLAAYLELFRVPLPVCLRPAVTSYRWSQDFQKGDLAIWLRRVGGSAISPYRVTYALYQVLRGDQLKLIGPAEREPAHGAVGEFYATGVAGAGGQPGRWVIKWHYQVSFNGPTYEEAMEFNVLDAVLAKVPDPSRVCKRGWF